MADWVAERAGLAPAQVQSVPTVNSRFSVQVCVLEVVLVRVFVPSNQEDSLARKTVFVSDLSGNEITDGKAARISISFQDARKGTYVLDVTEDEAEELGRKGTKQARRGRRPKAAA